MNNRSIHTAGRFPVNAYAAGLSVLNLGRRPAARLGLTVAAFALAPALAHAQTVSGGADPSTMLTNVASFVLGPFGKTLGILGIVGIGMAWMFGRASLGLVAGVVGGIIIMFGASTLATTLMGS